MFSPSTRATSPTSPIWGISVALIVAGWGLTPLQGAPLTQEQIEADWLTQDAVRWLGPLAGVTTRDDAQGACDGVRNGKWGFHTSLEADPWWQVDLGADHPLDRVLIYNRCDAPDRAAQLMVLLSSDGELWHQAYRHDGTVFYGAVDGRPLDVPLRGAAARFLRVQVPGSAFLHLDEVEVYGTEDRERNLALWAEADQSSVSQWSTRKLRPGLSPDLARSARRVVDRGLLLAADLRGLGVETSACESELRAVSSALQGQPSLAEARDLFLRAHHAVRRLALSNPLLDFEDILFVKRAPTLYSHMSDQHYGWWSRPGGGLYVLERFLSDSSRLRCLTEGLPEGSVIGPDLSYDGQRALFAYCRHYPDLAANPNKLNKQAIPEDAFYHIYEVNLDGTGLRRLTHGHYDDFDARYLPSGDIVFLSTRRGLALQCGEESTRATLASALPDCFVRCGGDPYRPVSVYTLHTMDSDGGRMRAISPFENFEWTPSVASDGRVLFARWDYVDRNNMPYMSLWSTNPDGTNVQAVYGNFTPNPHCIFEARSIPNSHKLIFTASGHHSITGGSLVLLDPLVGVDGDAPMVRLTPEVAFPESEGWPSNYYANPYPLSETYYLTAWSNVPLEGQGSYNALNALGIYLCDAFGNLELIYRDPDISSCYPMPVRPRPRPPTHPRTSHGRDSEPARVLLLNVYDGLEGVGPGTIERLRIVGVPPKAQPEPNVPVLGVTGDDPGKFVVGTVPVEPDGSANFLVPPGVTVFFQALDRDGLAVQTMRSATYMQPGQVTSCAGCHEPRTTAPRNSITLASAREPSRIRLGPDGSWPYRFDRLVQPVLDRLCVSCHSPQGTDPARSYDLTAPSAYEALISYGNPSLRDHVRSRYYEGRSTPNGGAAQTSALLALLRAGHEGIELDADAWERLTTWIDTYGQLRGSFTEQQERDLADLRQALAPDLLE